MQVRRVVKHGPSVQKGSRVVRRDKIKVVMEEEEKEEKESVRGECDSVVIRVNEKKKKTNIRKLFSE